MKNILRKIQMSLALLAVFAFTVNCSDDILDQPNPNALTPTSFWQTADDAECTIQGSRFSYQITEMT